MLRLSSQVFPAVLLSAAIGVVYPLRAADCTFIAHRDEILGRQARDRKEIFDRVRRFTRG